MNRISSWQTQDSHPVHPFRLPFSLTLANNFPLYLSIIQSPSHLMQFPQSPRASGMPHLPAQSIFHDFEGMYKLTSIQRSSSILSSTKTLQNGQVHPPYCTSAQLFVLLLSPRSGAKEGKSLGGRDLTCLQFWPCTRAGDTPKVKCTSKDLPRLRGEADDSGGPWRPRETGHGSLLIMLIFPRDNQIY